MNKSMVWLICNIRSLVTFQPVFSLCKKLCTKATRTDIANCYKILNIHVNSEQSEVREAFLHLAKKYHPDSGSPEANIDRFVAIENAFRILTKHNTGDSSRKDVERIVYDIRHTAPQHRQYLSFEGVGHGTPYQRQKQWEAARAQKAAENVMEHRLAKCIASDGDLMSKEKTHGRKHDIKTKYGFDRLVEDLIQESMSKGEFENLSGTGKPLKDQNRNPYVDFTTHKLNEVLINNGFTPEWITMSREIDKDIEDLKEEIKKNRQYLGPYPLTEEDEAEWHKIFESTRDQAQSINMRINKFNLIVPLINKQKFYVQFEEICEDILKNGLHSVERIAPEKVRQKTKIKTSHNGADLIGMLFKAFSDVFSFGRKKKNFDN